MCFDQHTSISSMCTGGFCLLKRLGKDGTMWFWPWEYKCSTPFLLWSCGFLFSALVCFKKWLESHPKDLEENEETLCS